MKTRSMDTFEIDQFVGKKIIELRNTKGIKAQQLAKALNITPQQLAKYEKGKNRISIGKLMFIAIALGENLSYFYNGAVRGIKINEIESDPMYLQLSHSFTKIKNKEYQKCIATVVKLLAENCQEQTV